MASAKKPILGERVYVAPTVYIGGDVQIARESTIMHYVVIRGDIAPIRIGARVNVQDGAVVHTPRGVPLDMADEVGVGHRAVVHCRRIGQRTLIGIGAVVLDGCTIGSRCIVAAGAVVPPGCDIPDDSVVMGVPGRIVRSTTAADLKAIDHVIKSYVELGRRHANGEFPNNMDS